MLTQFLVAAGEGVEDASASASRTAARHSGIRKIALSAETLRLYVGDWTRFARFCAGRGEAPMPASAELVQAFMARPGMGRAALRRHLAAIDDRHRRAGLALPGADPVLRAALKALHRAAPRAGPRAALSPDRLQELARHCPGDLAGTRDRVLLLLLATGLGRAAIVGLQAEHLRFTQGGVAHGAARIPRTDNPATCPVRALEAWLRASDTRYGPVFRKVNRWGGLEAVPLGTDAVRLILARRAR